MIEEILEHNRKFVQNKKYIPYSTDSLPEKKICILTCMDTRLMYLLPKAMGFQNGDIKIIKVAGATIINQLDNVIRSLIIGIFQLNIEEIIILGHLDCGVSKIDIDELKEKMINRNIDKDEINKIDLNKFIAPFDDLEESINNTYEAIKSHPLIPKDINLHKLIIDPKTGELIKV